ncbi:MAG: hypothetical protein K9M54_05905 [Kiritimatiellales bacterium]|nr:hypothetical protein [Kiritimatiellales bacterium]
MKPKNLLPLLLCCCTGFAADYQLQTLEKAHGMFRAATNATMYAAAARQYDYLVKEEGIRNGDLFYTLGNTWFLAGDVGRAILNYRRAEQYLPNSADVRNNLDTALAQRTDLVPKKQLPPLAASLLGWHFSTPAAVRGWLFTGCWLAAWGAWVWVGKTRKKEARITLIAAGMLSIALLASLLTETIMKQRADPGVIVAAEVLARKGDGEIYAPAFLDPLHAGTEFQRLEARGAWWHIRLDDGQDCWIPATAAETVAL